MDVAEKCFEKEKLPRDVMTLIHTFTFDFSYFCNLQVWPLSIYSKGIERSKQKNIGSSRGTLEKRSSNRRQFAIGSMECFVEGYGKS